MFKWGVYFSHSFLFLFFTKDSKPSYSDLLEFIYNLETLITRFDGYQIKTLLNPKYQAGTFSSSPPPHSIQLHSTS